MLKYFTLIISFFFSVSLYAQQNATCGTSQKLAEQFAKNPQLQQQLYQWLANFQDLDPPQGQPEAPKVIPVVVHVIHNYGQANITDAQIVDGIKVLNEDFQKLNADTSDIVSPFDNIIGDPDIEFRLAKLDPQGNCTNGITRTVSTLTFDASDRSKLVSWPRNKYLNIWVVSSIFDGSSPGVIAGYAYLPGTANPVSVDGIVIDCNYFGTIGVANPGNFAKRVLTHEAGHFWGLVHTFGTNGCGNGNCGGLGDFINDTPPTQGNCSTCNLSANSCTSDATIDNVQNYMDYALCAKMFTLDQASRIQFVLNDPAGQRNQLWTSQNLIATGTTTGFSNDCAPIVDFHSSKQTICLGGSVYLFDDTWNAQPTSWNWTITNGTNTINSTDSIPIVSFSQTGLYDVTLTVSAIGGNGTLTKQKSILVVDPNMSASSWFYYDELNNQPITNNRWRIITNENIPFGWEETQLASTSSPSSMRVKAYNSPLGKTFSIVSPAYDFTSVADGNVQLKFKYAFANTGSNNTDKLNIYFSTDCGNVWFLRESLAGGALQTTGTKVADWAPTSTEWETATLSNLQLFSASDNVLIKFEFVSEGGNNFYIDDINISTFTSTQEISDENKISIFPNPAIDYIQIGLQLEKPSKVSVQMLDIVGQIVKTKQFGTVSGNTMLQLNCSRLPAGLYMLRTYINGKANTKKILVK